MCGRILIHVGLCWLMIRSGMLGDVGGLYITQIIGVYQKSMFRCFFSGISCIFGKKWNENSRFDFPNFAVERGQRNDDVQHEHESIKNLVETTEEEVKQEPAWEGMSREERQEVLDQYQDMEIGSSDDDT